MWEGPIDAAGYGHVYHEGAQHLAHRLIYEKLVGPVPPRHQLDHRCRNRPCLNPPHLEPVLPAENMIRAYHGLPIAAGYGPIVPDYQRRAEEALAILWQSLESPESRRGYESDWRRWVEWCGGERISPAHATTPDVQRYMLHLQQSNKSRSTRARALAVLRMTYAAFVRAGILAYNPAREAGSIRVHYDLKTPWLGEDELRAILRRRPFPTWIQRRNWLLVAMFIGTGLRRAEVARLRRSTFRRGPHGLCVEVTVKGGKVGTVTIPGWLEAELTAFRCAGDHVFPAHEGIDKPVGHTTVWKAVKEAAGAAGIPLERATPHALRRSYVTLARSRGVSLDDLQAALLHSNRATTERYDHGAVMRPAPGEALADLVDPQSNPWDALKQR